MLKDVSAVVRLFPKGRWFALIVWSRKTMAIPVPVTHVPTEISVTDGRLISVALYANGTA